MKALFNKNGYGTEEIREYLPELWADRDFHFIQRPLEQQSLSIRKEIGAEIYDSALAHYQSDDFRNDQSEKEHRKKWDTLVAYIQSPVALFAYLSIAPRLDIQDTGNGRSQHRTDDTVAPWEWQIDRADDTIFRQGHKDVDLLLEYLEEEREIFQEWDSGEERAKIATYYIASASEFQEHFDIGDSRWLFNKLSPFIRKFQKKTIRAVLGKDLYESLLTKKADQSFNDLEQSAFIAAQEAIAAHSYASGLARYSMSFFPSGIAQAYTADRLTTKAKQVARASERQMLIKQFEKDKQQSLIDLQIVIDKINAKETVGEKLLRPDYKPTDKFFRP